MGSLGMIMKGMGDVEESSLLNGHHWSSTFILTDLKLYYSCKHLDNVSTIKHSLCNQGLLLLADSVSNGSHSVRVMEVNLMPWGDMQGMALAGGQERCDMKEDWEGSRASGNSQLLWRTEGVYSRISPVTSEVRPDKKTMWCCWNEGRLHCGSLLPLMCKEELQDRTCCDSLVSMLTSVDICNVPIHT